MARKYETKPDANTHRFIPVRPGFGKQKYPDNSKRAKFLRWMEKHKASAANRRKKHGRP